MAEFWDAFGGDTVETGDINGLDNVAVPSDPSQIVTDENDNMLTKLYGSLKSAGTAILDSTAQRITSTGDAIGNRIAQPAGNQSPTPVVTKSNSMSLVW